MCVLFLSHTGLIHLHNTVACSKCVYYFYLTLQVIVYEIRMFSYIFFLILFFMSLFTAKP